MAHPHDILIGSPHDSDLLRDLFNGGDEGPRDDRLFEDGPKVAAGEPVVDSSTNLQGVIVIVRGLDAAAAGSEVLKLRKDEGLSLRGALLSGLIIVRFEQWAYLK